jgi:alkanesulfonate monooxygenase SsuD/methylene tetrahydromethanopterin reductase-like flavin-dependent oxidoreductase (luciferase family)
VRLSAVRDRDVHHAQVLRHVVEEGVLADRVGLHFIGRGEHHRPDFAIAAPEVVLAVIAVRTTRIRLGQGMQGCSSSTT